MDQKYKEIVKESEFLDMLKKIHASMWNAESLKAVIGNGSCDQDSFVGAHVLAVMEKRIPIVNLPREIFTCKKDLLCIIEIMGIQMDDLVFLYEEMGEWVLCKGKEKKKIKDVTVYATLVDHNLPDKALLKYPSFNVDRIIDHHPILEMNSLVYGHVIGVKIELEAGSCCSLIYKEIKSKYFQKIEKDAKKHQFLALLTIPIQTDTKCLKNRTHPVDVVAVEELLSMGKIAKDESIKMFSLMKKKKKCDRETPTSLLLQMDYKSFEYPPECGEKTFGISSVGYAFDEWLERDKKDAFLSEVKAFAHKKKHEFFLINSKSNGVREFYLHGSPGPSFAENVLQDNGLCNAREIPGYGITVYKTNSKLSRKIAAPMIYEYLKKQVKSNL